MTIDTSAAPYFDDTEAVNNHKRILFKAGHAVQARELNSLQSSATNQMQSFAGHIFKNGSRVSNGAVSIIQYEYVRLATLTPDTAVDVQVEKILETYNLVGDSSGVEARFVHGVNAEGKDPATLYVVYTKTGIDAKQVRFVPGEEVSVNDEFGNTVYKVMVKCPTCPGFEDPQDIIPPCGMGGVFLHVADGVFYYDGFFINIPKSMLLFSKYGEAATCKIGFDVVEQIITAEDDNTLYDNALGYSNETAPGADRLVVNLVLTKRVNEIADGSKFIELAEIVNGYVQTIKSDYEYSAIMDTMAKRTFEESGNYTVSAWTPKYREHKKAFKDDPNGYIYGAEGKEELLNCVIGTGVGYVRGYRVETSFESVLDVPKARDTVRINNGSIFFNEGCYVDLIPDPDLSVWPNSPTSSNIVNLQEIQLYDGVPVNHAPTGVVIGSIRVADAIYMGKNADSKDVWRYRVISSNLSKPASTVKCISNETSRFLAVPADKTFTINNATQKDMFWVLPKNNVKSLRDSDNSSRGSITVQIRKKLNATLDSDGKYSFTLSSATFDSNIKDTIIIVGSAGNYVSIPATSTNCVPSGNSLAIDLGTTNSGKNLTVIHTVTNIDLLEKTKQSQTHIITGINRLGTNNFKNVIMLGKADVYKIEYVHAYSSASPAVFEDVTTKFRLNDGITPWAYNESSVQMIESENITNAYDTIDIKIRYLAHSDANSSGYFTIDSYASVINDVDSGIEYKNLPAYKNTAGEVYSANQILDFRTVNMPGDIKGEVPATRSTAIFDIEYYVGRIDLLCVDSDGRFFHMRGTPSDDPKPPTNVSDKIMPLYQVYIPAYTYSYKDVKIKLIQNKRYTMRDIGRLETRINNIEYYTTLSQLESHAAAASVKDSNGLDRYKNGFVVDDFSKYSTGDTASNEFKAVLDKDRQQLRPYYHMISRNASFNEKMSVNAIVRNGIALLPYEHELVDEQPFGSRPLSINPYLIYRKQGSLVLTPNVDSWTDTDRQPNYNIAIDTGVDAIAAMARRTNSMVSSFNDWRFANNTVITASVQGANTGSFVQRANNSSRVTTGNTAAVRAGITNTTAGFNSIINGTAANPSVTTTTTTTTDTRTETQASVEAKTNTYSFDTVTDVEIIAYMRATNIEFTATGLAPNTRFYVFFDKQDVTGLTSMQGSTNKIATSLQAGILLSDAAGVLSGVISIPAGRFFTGTRDVVITNDHTNSGDENLETSYATAQFFAGGIKQDKQQVNLNVTTPVYSEKDVAVTRQRTNTVVNINIPRPGSGGPWSGTASSRGRGSGKDPVAQSFKYDFDCFVSKLDVFFENIEQGKEIWFEIRTMDNGYPTETVLGRVIKKSESLKSSFDASVATEIEFPNPIRLQANVEYCFVVGGDSPATRIWIAKLGETAVNVPNKVVDTQVTLGTSFRSQNGSTWNAEQYEDIMYKLYVSKFTEQEMTIKFDVSGGKEESPLEAVPFEGEAGSNMLRVYVKNAHGLIQGDKVKINVYPAATYRVNLTNGNLVVGHKISIDNGKASAVVTSVDYVNATEAIVSLGELEGAINTGSTFIANPFIKSAGNKDVLKSHFDADVEDYDVRQAAGVFGNIDVAVALNGFSMEKLNGTHQVKRVDDSSTFVLEMEETATTSGRFGPSGATAVLNHKADMFNFSGSYLPHDATENWTVSLVSHGEMNSDFANTNYNTLDDKTFSPMADRYLDRPIKVATALNEHEHLADKASMIVTGKFKSDSHYLSPTFNIGTFSSIFISNDIGWLSKDAMNQSPNAVNRFLPETHPSQGSEHFKYVTNQINLANPAADLRIWFDMFKPSNSDFDLYIKFMTSEVDAIDDQDWTLIENIDKTPTSSNVDSYVEYDLLLSDLMPNLVGVNNLYSAYKFKIVAKCRNSAVPPVFKNLRLISYT